MNAQPLVIKAGNHLPVLGEIDWSLITEIHASGRLSYDEVSYLKQAQAAGHKTIVGMDQDARNALDPPDE